ncbi:MAG TPA: hypothetical protein VGE04_04645 [Chloroflexia bacterium]|jgi:hypothetical protein
MAHLNLDPSVLELYIEGFYGHGSYGAKYWFVAMEFGGGDTAREVVSRIQGWYDRGGKELEDLGPNGVGAGSRWFLPRYPLQPTWAKLIRVVLSAEGGSPTPEDIRTYQKAELGRDGGRDCILELLPLPSPGLRYWRFYPEYGQEHPRLSYLGERATYTSHVAPIRIAHLRKRISEYRPRAVVFYGTGYAYWWRRIAGLDFKPSRLDKVWVARGEDTLYVIMQHPIARGLPSTYFDAVGRLIAGVP